MKLQQVLSRVRQAVDDYHMVEENDCIAVGISRRKRQSYASIRPA